MYDKSLSIVIVNYNVKYFLEQCLCSVQAATTGMDVEVFVVDNNSPDGSLEYLMPLFPEVIFIANEDNPGFAKANNQAIRRCKGKYILLLNPDTVIGEDILRSLTFFMDEHLKAGAAGVKMLDGHGRFLPESKRSFPSPWVSFCKLSGLSYLFPGSKLFAKYSLPYLPADRQHKVDVLSGAFMLVRHEALDKAGLLDEAFFMYGEDIDLSYRIRLGGYSNYYIPERILHYKGESTRHNDGKYIRAFYGAMLIFFRKYYPRSGWLMKWLIGTGLGIRSKIAALFRPRETGRKKQRGIKNRRLLILCHEDDFGKIKVESTGRIPGLEHVNLWDLDEERVMDAICRRNRMKGFTDYVFVTPDIRYEQCLLFMDKLEDKNSTFHFYSKRSGQLISPGK